MKTLMITSLALAAMIAAAGAEPSKLSNAQAPSKLSNAQAPSKLSDAQMDQVKAGMNPLLQQSLIFSSFSPLRFSYTDVVQSLQVQAVFGP